MPTRRDLGSDMEPPRLMNAQSNRTHIAPQKSRPRSDPRPARCGRNIGGSVCPARPVLKPGSHLRSGDPYVTANATALT